MTDSINPDINEVEQSQLPALVLLQALGWTYLPVSDAEKARRGLHAGVLLEDVLAAQLARINTISWRGQQRAFSPKSIAEAIQRLKDVDLVGGTAKANEDTYNLLALGESFKEMVGDDTKSFSLQYIDWKHPANNVFHVCAEFSIIRSGSTRTRRPDIVLFVNGIPLAVIENKARDHELGEAISQMLRNQNLDEIPELFKYIQLVLGVNGHDGQYATAGTPQKFWTRWKTDTAAEAALPGIVAQKLTPEQKDRLFSDFGKFRKRFEEREGQPREVTGQDHLIYNLLRPERLLELARHFIVFEGADKKVARYQQYRAVKKALERLRRPDAQGRRLGGAIGHTQGSGKSLTMVMLASCIADEPEIADPRIVLVTDRVDLDKQIADTFKRCGLETKRAQSADDLRKLVESGKSYVLTTVINKFAAGLNKADFRNDSGNVFVLVDESHRTQFGAMHPKMKKVLPNACYIGFTGTPLLKAEKNTFDKFGGSIDVYTIRQATEDGAVVPLLYEGRLVEQEVTSDQLDTWFERWSAGLTDEQKVDLKRRYSRADILPQTQQYVRVVAFDVYEHFQRNWLDGGFKAMLVAPRKETALLYQEYFEFAGGVSTEVVISAPDDREGEGDPDESGIKRVKAFWKRMMEKYGDEERYLDEVIRKFKHEDDPRILIVVSKLLTGFDAPKATVLYLTRQLKDHTLLQAIARVNRVHDLKDHGYIIDYAGNLGNLDKALVQYQALEGFDAADIDGAVTNVMDEVAKLSQRHAELLALFKAVKNKKDMASLAAPLADQETREDFYERLRAFAKTLHLALSTQKFHEDTPVKRVAEYQADLRKFVKLRGEAALRYQEKVDFKKLEPQIRNLLDQYVQAKDVEQLTNEPIDILNRQQMDEALEQAGEPAAQADMIASATKRAIEVDLKESDPVLYAKFSRLIQDAIDDFRNRVIGEHEFLKRVKGIRDKYAEGRADDVPAALRSDETAQAFYRVLDKWAQSIGFADESAVVDLSTTVKDGIMRERAVDWVRKESVQNRMRTNIDEAFIAFEDRHGVKIDFAQMDELTDQLLQIAAKRMP